MPQPWWLSPDSEHAHTACPLRPFAHMVVALHSDGDAGGAHTMHPPITAARLAAAKVVHLSEALRRKMHSIAPGTVAGATVGDIMVLGTRASGDGRAAGTGGRVRAMSAGLWHMLGWLVGAHDDAAPPSSLSPSPSPPPADDGEPAPRLPQRHRHAHTPEDDPLLVGNEGLGAVDLASTHDCVFALCAHALSPVVQAEWQAWHVRRGGSSGSIGGRQLAIIHVAEVSTLHRVACHGVDALVPSPLPLEQYFAHMLDVGRPLGPPPTLPCAVSPESVATTANLPIHWMSLLVSRHGLVEMAYPLSYTPIEPLGDPALETGPPVALGSYLGESVFSRVHPEDVARVVKALRLAWDARPDIYHFARLRREWQRRRLSSATDRATASAPSTPPLRAHRAATLPIRTSGSRQLHQQDGIEVANGVVELNMQIQLSGGPRIDWDDADATSQHTRFARMKLTRWPLIIKPPRQSCRSHEPEDPHDGFVLVAVRPLPEPSRTRAPASLAAAPKKRSISSVASTSTLVGVADSAELVRLCRSTSSLSCHETTARPSVDVASSSDTARTAGLSPVARPIVGLSNSAVQTATAMSPHLTMRRRSNIPIGSLPADDALRHVPLAF
ncbi:hypothetical protein GGF46_000839 [Coemansia sp. RSA 552]|nr:hypothetical protein GGF46_000839 [Coemansia sp. RSA 552]